MTDIANLVLAVDSTQVKTGTAALDGLTAAGTRAEAATVGLSAGTKGAAAQAAAMAAAAQASARAATGMATGFKASSDALRVNTIAMRETLVVARELSRGNFTRLPGSLTLLAQGIGSQGGIKAFGAALTQTLGLVRTVQNAELAEQATNAAAAASAVESAAARAAAAVTAADTELALAEAQLRVTAGTSAEGAAQIRLAEAHQAVAAAAGEAAIAENALAAAYVEADAAAAASAAESSTVVTGLGVALGLAAIAAGLAAAALAGVKDAAEQADPSAQHLISTLGLTTAEVKKLKDTTVTWGDVAHGTFNAVAAAAGTSSSQIAGFFREAFLETAQVGVSAAQVILASFAAMVKGVHSLLGNLPNIALGIVNPAFAGLAAKGIGAAGSDAVAQFRQTFGNVGKFFQQTLPNSVNAARDARVRAQANALIADRKPPREAHPRGASEEADNSIQNEKAYQDEVARLNDQILAAKKQLAGSAQEQAAFAVQEVDVEKNKTIADAKAQLAEGKISAGEEQHLELLANQLAELKKQAIYREEQTKLLSQQQAAQDQIFQFANDNLKFADEMATNQADHRQLQLDMLNIAYQQKAYDLQILKSKQELAQDYAAAAITQGQINNLPVQQAQERARILQNTQNPLEQWARTIPKTAQDVIEAMQTIESRGLDQLSSAIASVVTGTESLKQAFGDLARSVIADIVQMTVKMLIFRALSSAFGSIFGGSIGAPDLGSPMPVTVGGQVPLASLPGFAGGGSFMIGGNSGVDQNVLSINGVPQVRVGQGERLAVFPRGQAANTNQAPTVVEIRLVDDMLDARIVQGAGKVVSLAAPTIAQEAAKGAVIGITRATGRPKLSGRA